MRHAKTGWKLMLSMALAGMLAGTIVADEEGWKERRQELKEKRKVFHQEQKERRQTHHQTQKSENKEFRDSLKNSDMSAEEKEAACIAHHEKQKSENQTFMAEQHERRVAFIKENVPEDRQAQAIEKAEEKYREWLAKCEKKRWKLKDKWREREKRRHGENKHDDEDHRDEE